MSKRSYRCTLPSKKRKAEWRGAIQKCFTGDDDLVALEAKYARVWYCKAYEKGINNSKEACEVFGALMCLLQAGYNVLLKGPDGFPLTQEDLESAYENPNISFGHERVAVTMLNSDLGIAGWRRIWNEDKYKVVDA